MGTFLKNYFYFAAKITPNFVTFVTIDKIFAERLLRPTIKKTKISNENHD